MTGADDDNDDLVFRQKTAKLAINGGGPVVISMSQEEYTSRTSRESILQRLSEALLRHSLAKVSNWKNDSLVKDEYTMERSVHGGVLHIYAGEWS